MAARDEGAEGRRHRNLRRLTAAGSRMARTGKFAQAGTAIAGQTCMKKAVLGCLVVIVAAFMVARLVGRMPANCDAVAEQLASYELGNYAEPEDRAPVVDKDRAACRRESVSQDEAACLDKARSKLAAARCVPRLFPDVEVPDCDGATCYLQKLKQLTEQMCACRPGDKPCADKVNEAMTRWGQAWAKLASEPGAPRPEPWSESDTKALRDTMMRYSECTTKALTVP